MTHAAYDLRIEYLENPMGIDIEKPRFSWKMRSDVPNAMQSAYEIIISTDAQTVWTSGRIESTNSVMIPYQGPTLKPRTRYDVKIVTCDQNGKAGMPATGFFETGWGRKKWDAKWVRGAVVERGDGIQYGTSLPPVNYFRKDFTIAEKVVRARLYATSLGIFEGYCNGKMVSDELFSPGWTDYFERVQYRTYDVTHLLNQGSNAVGFKLATGWFAGRISYLWNGNVPTYGSTPKLRAMLVCDYADGHSEVIGTDGTWRCSNAGPERYSDIYDGEHYDARLRMDDFATPNFSQAGWAPATECGSAVKLCGAAYAPVRRIEELAPISVTEPKKGKFIVDFGQNVAGRERIHVTQPAGAVIVVRHGEMLNPDGTLYTENLRSAKATTMYICDGTERDYEPAFTFYGFRYLEIYGDIANFDFDAIRVQVLHSDMPRTGYFECSNPKLNQLFSNLVWGQRGNYLDVPTDCPQRDERLGWTGDAQAFVRVASYNFQVGAFFSKYLADLELSRNEFGEYAPFAPNSYYRSISYERAYGVAGWADAGVICPFEIFRKYADRALLERHFDAMADFVRNRALNSTNLLDDHACYGDWLNIGAPLPPELTGTAFFAHSADLVRSFAAVLGRHEEEKEFAELFEAVKKAYCSAFLDEEGRLKMTWEGTKRSIDAGDSKGIPLSCRTQTGALLSLHFDLLPASSVQTVLADLVADIQAHEMHLSTGFLGTPYLAPVLARFGRGDIAYKLLEQTSYPSWLYSVEQGATTIWERWNSYSHKNGFGEVGMNSFNHYAYGAVGDFMYETVAGITPIEPGFRKFSIAPMPGGTLTHAKAQYESEYGLIVSDWRITDGVFELDVTIPPNTECRVTLPDGAVHAVTSGMHHYRCAL